MTRSKVTLVATTVWRVGYVQNKLAGDRGGPPYPNSVRRPISRPTRRKVL